MKAIREFRDAYAFLSNFYCSPIKYKGLIYLNAEAAFQAQKETCEKDKEQYTRMNPAQAKLVGRNCNLREDWEEIKEQIMYEIVKAKFTQNPNLARLLLDTGNAYLEEGNWWHDTTWGVCNAVGENKLGKILMRVREELDGGIWE
jgi:ribA/ribD-fused uncharacterized protein